MTIRWLLIPLQFFIVSGTIDESFALLQSQVKIHDSFKPANFPRGGLERLLVRNAFSAIDTFLDKYEARKTSNLKQAEEMRSLVDRYLHAINAFSQRVNGSTQLSAYENAADLVNNVTVLKVLELFRDQKMVDSFETGFQNINRIGTAFCLRMEKHITNLRELTMEGAPTEVPGFVDQFFQRQEHITKTTLASIAGSLKEFFSVLPGKYRRVADISEGLFARLTEKASADMVASHRKLMRAEGSDFCMETKRISRQMWSVHPIMQQTLSTLPVFEVFSQTSMPVVTPVLKRLSKKLKKGFETWSKRVDRDMRILEKTLCDLVPQDRK